MLMSKDLVPVFIHQVELRYAMYSNQDFVETEHWSILRMAHWCIETGPTKSHHVEAGQHLDLFP